MRTAWGLFRLGQSERSRENLDLGLEVGELGMAGFLEGEEGFFWGGGKGGEDEERV